MQSYWTVSRLVLLTIQAAVTAVTLDRVSSRIVNNPGCSDCNHAGPCLVLLTTQAAVTAVTLDRVSSCIVNNSGCSDCGHVEPCLFSYC
jgi:hypothetical protein